MKLHRFTASDTQRAILNVHEKLGPDALVYSTRKLEYGVEVLAGLPAPEEGVEEQAPSKAEASVMTTSSIDNNVIERLNGQLQRMDDSIRKLSRNIDDLQQAILELHRERINQSITVPTPEPEPQSDAWSKSFGKIKELIGIRYKKQAAH